MPEPRWGIAGIAKLRWWQAMGITVNFHTAPPAKAAIPSAAAS